MLESGQSSSTWHLSPASLSVSSILWTGLWPNNDLVHGSGSGDIFFQLSTACLAKWGPTNHSALYLLSFFPLLASLIKFVSCLTITGKYMLYSYMYINTHMAALWWRQITKILTARVCLRLMKPVTVRCPQKVPFSLSLAREQACVYTNTNAHIHTYIYISIYAHVHLNTCSVHLLTQALC